MSVIDFHPDDLLDREQRGVLSESERVRLADHLDRCAVCRLERMMRADFAEDAAHAQVVQGLSSQVSVALARAAVPPLLAAGERPSRRARFGALLVSAVLLCMGGVAAARAGLVESTYLAARAQVESVLGQKAKPKRTRAPRKTPRRADSAPVVAGREPAAAPSAEAVVSASAPPTAKPSHRGRMVAPAAPAEPVPSTVTGPSEAELRFERATLVRRSGDAEQAIAAYRNLITAFPASPEAQLSHALLGRLLLDLGRAEPALREFDAYLGTAAQALREDGLAGRARALERLGRSAEARAAYTRLLQEFPRSPYAAWAEGQRGRD